MGSYTYDPVRKHAVTSAGGVSYGYDAQADAENECAVVDQVTIQR